MVTWERGSGGVKSTGVSQSVRETSRDESQNVLSTPKLFKTRDLELPNLQILSQAVRRTPRDTPVLPRGQVTVMWNRNTQLAFHAEFPARPCGEKRQCEKYWFPRTKPITITVINIRILHSGTPVRVFQSGYTIAIVYRLYVFHVSQGIALYQPQGPQFGVSQDHVRSMLLVSQLKPPSRFYRAIGVSQLYCRKCGLKRH